MSTKQLTKSSSIEVQAWIYLQCFAGKMASGRNAGPIGYTPIDLISNVIVDVGHTYCHYQPSQ